MRTIYIGARTTTQTKAKYVTSKGKSRSFHNGIGSPESFGALFDPNLMVSARCKSVSFGYDEFWGKLRSDHQIGEILPFCYPFITQRPPLNRVQGDQKGKEQKKSY